MSHEILYIQGRSRKLWHGSFRLVNVQVTISIRNPEFALNFDIKIYFKKEIHLLWCLAK